MADGEDRITTKLWFAGYEARNSNGELALEISPFSITVADQSPASASAHLIAVVEGLLGPAQKQVTPQA